MCFVKVPQPHVFGGMVGITPENTYAACEGCGMFFKVNLYEVAWRDNIDEIRGMLDFPLCHNCSSHWDGEDDSWYMDDEDDDEMDEEEIYDD